MRKQLCVIVGVLASACLSTIVSAQAGAMIKVEDGKLCKIGFGPRDPPPKPPQTAAACVVYPKDVRDHDGEVVSEIGFYAWTEGTATRVQVFLMVPAPGAPNRWLKEKGDDPKLLRLKAFATYQISLGQSKRIEELKTLGLEPWVMRFESGPR